MTNLREELTKEDAGYICHSVTMSYIKGCHEFTTRKEWFDLRKQAAVALSRVQKEKSNIIATGRSGRFIESQLDIRDVLEQKMCAVFDNCEANAMKIAL